MKTQFLLAFTLAFSTSASGATSGFEMKVEVHRNAELFLRHIVALCLSSPESSAVIDSPSQLTIRDRNKGCAREIQPLASDWDRTPEPQIAAVYAKMDMKPRLTKKIREKYADQVQISESQNCPCLVVRGERAREAADYASRY